MGKGATEWPSFVVRSWPQVGLAIEIERQIRPVSDVRRKLKELLERVVRPLGASGIRQ